MKILALSDIDWLNISTSELISVVNQKRPELVLLAGDLVNNQIYVNNGEVVSKDICWGFVVDFFEFCEKEKIQVFYIRGNWDSGDGFREVQKKKFKYIIDISYKIKSFRGIEILGLPYEFTNDLRGLKYFINNFRRKVDIVLAHAEKKRRVWLFHLRCKMIVTGHIDKQLSLTHKKLFVSLENFPREYVFINFQNPKGSVDYFDHRNGKSVLRKATFSMSKLEWKSNRFRSHRVFSKRIEKMLLSRIIFIEDKSRKNDLKKVLLQYGVPNKHIEEYLTL